jgi:hypothetical protein
MTLATSCSETPRRTMRGCDGKQANEAIAGGACVIGGCTVRYQSGLLLAWSMCLTPAFAAERSVAPIGDNDVPLQFDIAPQSLQDALERYSQATGRSVIYQGQLAQGHVAPALRGRFSADEGLRQLLQGSGLMSQYSDRNRVVLLPATPQQNDAPAVPVVLGAAQRAYFGSAQRRLRERLCHDRRVAPGHYRAAVAMRVDPQGHVSDLALLDTTHDAERDAALVEALSAITFDAPPAGMPQPLTLLILPRDAARSDDCAGLRPTERHEVEEPIHG